MKNDFVHLHVHTHYSIKDGLNTPSDMMAKAQSLGMKAIAITDHGNMFGTAEYYLFAKNYNIKPILGSEFYIIETFERLKESRKNGHIIMLAKNLDGYRELNKLNFLSYRDGKYYKNKIDKKLLMENDALLGNVIVTTTCLASLWNQSLEKGEHEEAVKFILNCKERFGSDFYIEFQFNEMKEQHDYNQWLYKMHREFDIPAIMTNDCHYVEASDQIVHANLLRLQSNITRSCRDVNKAGRDQGFWEFETKELYVKTKEQMFETAHRMNYDFPDSLFEDCSRRTIEISEKIEDYQFDTSPKIVIPVGYENQDRKKVFEDLCWKGLRIRKVDDKKEYQERLKFELEIIIDANLFDYFLVVYDIVKRAKKLGIFVGPGRGSAAGSLMSYCLGITQIDPIRFDLYFERFINPARIKEGVPDIDIDFSDNGKVKDMLFEIYGKDRVAYVSNYGSFRFNGLFRDLCRIYEVNLNDVNAILKDCEKKVYAEERFENKSEKKLTYDTCMKWSDLFKEFMKKFPELEENLKKLHGKIRHIGKHASGMVIADNLADNTPVFVRDSDDMKMQTGFTEGIYIKSLPRLGYVKYDILGLTTLSVIENTLKMLSKKTGKKYKELYLSIHPDRLDLNDDDVYKNIYWTGDLENVFQFESHGIRHFAKDIKPTNFEELSAIIALYRPGPLQSGLAANYRVYKDNPEKIPWIHPLMKNVFGNTFGILIFQEQIMKMGEAFGGMTLAESDTIRKVFQKTEFGKEGQKEKQEKTKKIKQSFFKKFKELGIEYFEDHDLILSQYKDNTEETRSFNKGLPPGSEMIVKEIDFLFDNNYPVGNRIWEFMLRYTGYSFNRSHTISYAMISYQTAYLKYYHPLEFYASCLITTNNERYKKLKKEAKDHGVEMMSPDINKSSTNFSIYGDKIIFGISNIHNCGIKAPKMIIENRPEEGWKDFVDFITDPNLNYRTMNSKVFTSLILSGCFDSFGEDRHKLLKLYEIVKGKGWHKNRKKKRRYFKSF